MKVYRHINEQDFYQMLEEALMSNHVIEEAVSPELASLLYDFFSGVGEIDESNIFDYIRFEMDIMTADEIVDAWEDVFKEYAEKNDIDLNDITDEIVEDFLMYHTLYIGSYSDNGEIFHAFSGF